MRSRTQMQRELLFLIIKQNKEQQKPPRRGKTIRQAEDWSTVNMKTHMTKTHERQRISTGLQTKGDYIGRQTRVTRQTQLEPLKQWLRNKMGGDRQSTWEHMAPNKQQAMCSTHRDIWWPAWAHQQDRDTDKIFFSVWSSCLILTSVFYRREIWEEEMSDEKKRGKTAWEKDGRGKNSSTHLCW